MEKQFLPDSMNEKDQETMHHDGLHSLQQRVQELEQVYSFFEELPDAVFVISSAHDIVHVNRQGHMLIGGSREGIIGQAVDHLFPAEAEKIKHAIDTVVQQKRICSDWISPSPRHIQPHECMFSPLPDSGGDVSMVMMTIRSCSRSLSSPARHDEQQMQELHLPEEELLFLSMLHESLIGVAIYDPRNESFAYVNPRFTEIFGYTQEEINGLTLMDVIAPEDKEMAMNYLLKRKSWEQGKMHWQFLGMRKDGKSVDIDVMSNDTRYKGKQAILVLILDISERKQVKEIVKKSEMLTLVGQLAAGVAHEIRNPLTAIKGFLQLLQSEKSGKAEYYQIMLDELNRIEFIISEFLVLAKPQLERRESSSIIYLLQNIIILVETHAIINNVQIFLQFEPDIPQIICEENQMKQVFINIMKNAIEAMPDGGNLVIEVRRQGGEHILIRFVDQGCGIPEEILPKLGQPFYTTKEKGTGLGMMVSYKIIENHHGTISVKSEQNVGTTVEIILPIG